MFEVLTCQKPYANKRDKTRNLIVFVDALKNGLRPEPVPDNPENIFQLITNCWSQDREERPSMQQVLDRTASIREKRYIFTTICLSKLKA